MSFDFTNHVSVGSFIFAAILKASTEGIFYGWPVLRIPLRE